MIWRSWKSTSPFRGAKHHVRGLGGNGEVEPVEIRKLVPLGVDLEIIRIAIEHRELRGCSRRRLDDPRFEHRAVRIHPPAIAVDFGALEIELRPPVAQTCGLSLGIGFWIVAGMKFRAVLLVKHRHDLPFNIGELKDEHAVGLAELHLEGRVVNDLDRVISPLTRIVGAGSEPLFVLKQIIESEGDIGGGKGRTVRPLHTVSQAYRILGSVFVDIIALGQIGQHLLPFKVPREQALVAEKTEQMCPVATLQRKIEIAAVAPYPLDWRDDHREWRQTDRPWPASYLQRQQAPASAPRCSQGSPKRAMQAPPRFGVQSGLVWSGA